MRAAIEHDEFRVLQPPAGRKVKVALLADAATQRLVPELRILFQSQGVDAEIFEGRFDAIEMDVSDSRRGLYPFQPDVVVILNAVQALRSNYAHRQGDASAFVTETADRMVRVWDTLRLHSAATIIQSNFALPYERFFGNFDQKVPESFYSVVLTLNAHLAETARERRGVLINDVEAVASWVGRQHWFDDRWWDLAKYPCAVDHFADLARNIVDIVMASLGRVVKCVVVDLDNTLWGGTIGDDGLDGIRLDAHGEGESYYRLQCYLRELLRRGILLAVCSKNDSANALLPFEKHPGMVLKRDQFAAFVANWNDKADNIRKIREELNIGFDSMVFLDDNPFERNLVHELLPDVIVPELPEDPADYVRAISELNLFETVTFSAEDMTRAEMYRQMAKRKESRASFANAEDFLQSLEMRITVARVDSFHVPRAAQLTQRSNQFNLTTRRLSEGEFEGFRDDPRWIPLYAKLADRLGDHGLISVVILEVGENELAVRDWLMSCRVMGRGVEQYLMNSVFELARRLRLERVVGEYIPTAKNGMVKDFFAQFGFFKLQAVPAGYAHWALQTDAYQPVKTLIKAADPEAAGVAIDERSQDQGAHWKAVARAA
jgi:FkbH-like protein